VCVYIQYFGVNPNTLTSESRYASASTDGLSYKEHTSTHAQGTDPKMALEPKGSSLEYTSVEIHNTRTPTTNLTYESTLGLPTGFRVNPRTRSLHTMPDHAILSLYIYTFIVSMSISISIYT